MLWKREALRGRGDGREHSRDGARGEHGVARTTVPQSHSPRSRAAEGEWAAERRWLRKLGKWLRLQRGYGAGCKFLLELGGWRLGA